MGHSAQTQIIQQSFHFADVKLSVNFHSRMTGHYAEDFITRFIKSSALPVSGEFIQNVEQQSAAIRASEQGRDRFYDKGATAEIFNNQSADIIIKSLPRGICWAGGSAGWNAHLLPNPLTTESLSQTADTLYPMGV